MADNQSTAEQNARMRARADYFRWLNKYYGSAELAEMSDEPEPVNLRQIFVPMRVGKEDLAETTMSQPSEVAEKETDADLPGQDAFELIAEQSFVCLSGLPGSGKTTLTKALIGELCGNHPSRLRTALESQRGIAPIPLILREISAIGRILTLEALMEAWWQNLERKTEQGDPLDMPRLRNSFSVDEDNFPLLLLFDGIDEIGGADVRQILLDIAAEAYLLGHRVLVTGRPNGFADVHLPQIKLTEPEIQQQPDISEHIPIFQMEGDSGEFFVEGEIEAVQKTDMSLSTSTTFVDKATFTIRRQVSHYHLLPLAWPQIQNFIDRWYHLRPEWEIKRKDGTDHFLEALQDNNRSYLLTLARRPIFLTLMALVHCTRNEMPHGRADLYEAIVDLYLNRQERHRQLKYGTKGNVLKVWPVQEKRRVLGRIAFESQLRGADQQEDGNNPDQRRILWPQAELRDFIAIYLQERAGSGGIAPEDAEALLEYYLHPAGLLISPRAGEISFAHLSFQEYLCAEDIQRRLSGRNFETIFHKDLADRLSRPGWDEVGLLLLAIHKNRSEDGHLELLGMLRPQKPAEATLLVRGLCGKELGLTLTQQHAWLPVLLFACLLHPNSGLAYHLGDCPQLADEGLKLVLKLLYPLASGHSTKNAKKQWKILQQQVDAKDLPLSWEKQQAAILKQWCKPNWNQEESPDSSRFYSLLAVLVNSQWGLQNDKQNPIAVPALELALADALINESLLWRREITEKSMALPVATQAGIALDALLPDHGLLWRCSLERLPLDTLLLQGEGSGQVNVFGSQTVSLVFYPSENLPARARLGLGLYQAILLTEHFLFLELFELRTELLIRSLSGIMPRSIFRGSMLRRSRSSSIHSPKHSRSASISLSWSRSLSQTHEQIDSLTQTMSFHLLLTLSQSDSICDALRQTLKACAERLMPAMVHERLMPAVVHERLMPAVVHERLEPFVCALERFGYHHATHVWFSEQAEEPDLMTRRGLRPTEPLPRSLGLFDERGMPLEKQQRHCWLELQTWLLNDDAVLKFFFPEGLNNEENAVLRTDLALLKTQPWSPQAFATAALANWPEAEPQRDFSFATAQNEMLAACQAFLAATG